MQRKLLQHLKAARAPPVLTKGAGLLGGNDGSHMLWNILMRWRVFTLQWSVVGQLSGPWSRAHVRLEGARENNHNEW
eukprot:5779430-Amphidinium_carterae.1